MGSIFNAFTPGATSERSDDEDDVLVESIEEDNPASASSSNTTPQPDGGTAMDEDSWARRDVYGRHDSTSDDMMEVHEPIMAWWHDFQRHGIGRFIMEHTAIIRDAAEPETNGLTILWAPFLAIGIPLTILPVIFAGRLGWIIAAPMLVVTLAGLLMSAIFWVAWRHDKQRNADALNTRKGFMTAHEVASAYGPRQLVRRAPRFLPATAARLKARGLQLSPWDAGVLMGHAHGVEVWATVEQPLYCVGPARMGKTRNYVLPLVMGAPGPVIATSTRRDIIDQTKSMRESGWQGSDGLRHRGGTCWVFDPVGIARGNPAHSLNWSPVDGCEDPHVARRRAADLTATTGLSGDNATWRNSAGAILQALLHAAALKPGGSIEDVYQWSRSFSAAQQAAKILEDAAIDPKYERQRADGEIAVDWNMELEALKLDDAKMKGNKWYGVAQAMQALGEPKVRRALSVAHDDPNRFQIDKFLKSHDTIYLLSEFRNTDGDDLPGIGGFVSMFLTSVVEEARKLAAGSVGMGKLEPPVALILDEIANISKWSMLPQVITAGSGDGIWATAIYQSRSQARSSYGEDTEREMWDSSQKWLLGGISSTQDLKEISDLLGTRQVRRKETTHEGMKIEYGHVTDRIEDKPVLAMDEARDIPEDMALYLSGRNRGAIVNLIPPEKRDWKPIAEEDRL